MARILYVVIKTRNCKIRRCIFVRPYQVPCVAHGPCCIWLVSMFSLRIVRGETLRSFSSTSFEVRVVENRDAKKTGVCVYAANICQLAGVQRACNLRCSSFLCFHVCCSRISTILCFQRGLEGFISSV